MARRQGAAGRVEDEREGGHDLLDCARRVRRAARPVPTACRSSASSPVRCAPNSHSSAPATQPDQALRVELAGRVQGEHRAAPPRAPSARPRRRPGRGRRAPGTAAAARRRPPRRPAGRPAPRSPGSPARRPTSDDHHDRADQQPQQPAAPARRQRRARGRGGGAARGPGRPVTPSPAASTTVLRPPSSAAAPSVHHTPADGRLEVGHRRSSHALHGSRECSAVF